MYTTYISFVFNVLQMSRAGYRSVEPVVLPDEEPTVISNVVNVHMTKHGYSIADLSRMAVLPELVCETAQHFNVSEVSADKGYSSRANLEVIASVGAKPFVAFKANASGKSSSPLWNKLFHYFQLNTDEYMARYHTRSNVESTFSAMKRKFGDIIRSKSEVARRNELLLKCLCHNLVCVIHAIQEGGAVGTFPALGPTCPINPLTAQQSLDWRV